MINEPDYDISIKSGGEIVIMRNSDFAIYSGNYNTDDEIREICDILTHKSRTRKCRTDKKESEKPLFEVKTVISSVKKDENGVTTINVPQNPFLDSFKVSAGDFQFSEGQHIWYTDSVPPQMLIGDEKKSTTIMEHSKMGWMDKTKYDYHQLNEASKTIYDMLIQGADHHKLCSYLQDVEKIYNGEDTSFLVNKSEEYREKATALAKEYRNISRKSGLRDGEFCLMHPDDVRDSVIVKSVKDYVPSHIATNSSTIPIKSSGRFL